MLSIDQIRADADNAGRKARKAGKVPKLFTNKNERTQKFCRTIPYLGSYVPSGWYLEKTTFVDSSGFGSSGGLAMGGEQFLTQLEIGKGYGIIEAGEFQVYIGVFIKE